MTSSPSLYVIISNLWAQHCAHFYDLTVRSWDAEGKDKYIIKIHYSESGSKTSPHAVPKAFASSNLTVAHNTLVRRTVDRAPSTCPFFHLAPTFFAPLLLRFTFKHFCLEIVCVCARACAHMQVKNNTSPFHMDSRDQTQAIRLEDRHLYPPWDLTSSFSTGEPRLMHKTSTSTCFSPTPPVSFQF